DDRFVRRRGSIRKGRGCLRLPGRATGSCQNLAVEIGFQGRGPGLAQFFERGGDEGLAIDDDFETFSAGGSDAGGEKVVLAGHGIDLGEVFGIGGDDERGCWFGEKAEERVSEERW